MDQRSFKLHPVLAAVLLIGVTACSETVPAPTAKPAPATDVGRVEAWRDAERVTAADDQRITVAGSGESMRPIYGENTVLVITKIAFENLKAGMQAAYISEAGRRVVHVLIEPDSRGWRVQGLNNVTEDRERVTRYNLIGVVYASFTADDELK
jgi:D-alanyl-D-alanine dipeptidase